MPSALAPRGKATLRSGRLSRYLSCLSLGETETALGGRIFAVADALDAMTSDRPYRRALRWSAARDEILAQTGKQFDPDVVDAFREREGELQDVQRELTAA